MYLRRAEMKDLPQIESIIQDGKRHLAAQHIDQWQGIYPDTKILVDDIQNGHTMILVEDYEVLGAAAVIPGPDDSYQDIDGKWLTDDDSYVAIHRVAVSANHRGHGLAGKLFNAIFEEVDNFDSIKGIRIDTHPDNLGMQHIIEKSGFTKTGTVEVKADDLTDVQDFAYERLTRTAVPAGHTA